MWILLVLVGVAIVGGGRGELARADGESENKAAPALRYLTSSDVMQTLKQLKLDHTMPEGMDCLVLKYGKSALDRPLAAIFIGRKQAPTVLVHGGLMDRDCAGTVACVELARRILANIDTHTKSVSWLIIPAPHPDALDAFLAGRPSRTHKSYLVDRDLDGTRGEDGPHDINGDGVVAEMRIRDASGTWVPSEKDNESSKKDESEASPSSGREEMEDAGVDARRAVSYRLLDEGADLDGDGEIGEDPPSLDLSRNMTGYWTHAGPWGGEGPFPGWAPETKALMDLTYGITNLVAWYSFTSSGDEILRANANGKINDADGALYKRIAAALKERVGLKTIKASDSYEAGNPGCDLDWAGVHLTVPAFRVPIWRLPMMPMKKAAKDSSNDEEVKKSKAKDEAKPKPYASWLAWDEAENGGEGFMPWTAHKHPTLGDVELGGWKPFYRYEPPESYLSAAVAAVVEAPLVHSEFAPALKLTFETKSLGVGIVEVTARVMNVGHVPTSTASARKRKRSMSVRVEWDLAGDVTLVGGKRHVRVGHLDAGKASKELRWLLRKNDGAALLGTLKARHRVAGSVSEEVRVP